MSALKYLTLNEPTYVPKYNNLNTNLVNTVDQTIQQQDERATQSVNEFDVLRDTTMNKLGALPDEAKQQVSGLIDQSRNSINEIVERRGPRFALPYVQEQARQFQQQVTPYLQETQKFNEYITKVDEVGAENNVSANVRRMAKQRAGFGQTKDGLPQFEGINLEIFDNWKDLDDVTKNMANEIEPFVTESVMQGQPLVDSNGNVMEIDGEVDAYFSRMKNKTMGYPGEPVEERTHQILMSRLINDPDIQEQLALQVQGNGKEPTEQNIMDEALRIVAPHVAAKARAEQTYSSPIQNPKFFASLNNGKASGNGVFTIPITTVAGPVPYDNPVSLDDEIKSYESAYDAELDNAVKEGVIERTPNGGYNVVKQNQYNSYYANKLDELSKQLESIRGRKSRMFTKALNEFYKDSDTEITEENHQEFMENLSSDIERSNQAVSELVTEISRGGDVSDNLRYAARQANISQEELVRNIIDGQSIETMGLTDFIGDLPRAKNSVEKIRERFNNWHDLQLNKYSEEYQTYSKLLEEDAKGRTTTTNIIKTLDDNINRVGEQSFNSTIRLRDGQDVRFFDVENAGQSIYDKYDEREIQDALETLEFEGYAYHPDDGRPIVTATANIAGNQHTLEMDMSSDIIKSMNLLNNDQAYKSHLNNSINTIASNPDRRGKLVVPFIDNGVEKGLELSLSMPHRTTDSKGNPIVSGDVPIELDLSKKGKRDVRKFRSTEELISFVMHQLPEMLSPKENESE